MSKGPALAIRVAAGVVASMLLVGVGRVLGRFGPSLGKLDDVARLAQMVDDPEAYAVQVERGCEAGKAKDFGALGVHYAFGTYGRTKDYAKAHTYLKRACDAGEAYGCQDLGVLYKFGRGVDKDAAEAMRLFEISCAGGVANGCHYLGEYRELGGDVVTQDLDAARGWYDKACAAGSESSCGRPKAD